LETALAGHCLMKILISGACGFVGSALAECLLERVEGIRIAGIDNLMRPGAETNRCGSKGWALNSFMGT
jgi:CDP-paratose 2-epimerase